MNILQVEKSVEYVLSHILIEDLHFLRYQEFPTKGGGTKMVRRFDSVSVMNMTIDKITDFVKDENAILIQFLNEKA